MLEAQAPVEHVDEIDSTIVEARRRAEFGDLGPVWLTARVQTAGRGRRGRAWTTIEGNLFATYLGATRHPPAKIALLGFAAGIAIAETVDAFVGAGHAALKWPNDLMLDGAKAAGIMLDSGAAGQGVTWFALGFGVNLVGAPRDVDQRTASLASLLGEAAPSAPEFLIALRPRLESWAARLEANGFAPLRDAWLMRAHGMGGPARIVVGEETIEGIVQGLSAHGELEFATPSGLRYVSAGDIHFPNAAA